MLGQVEHILRNFYVLDVVEVFLLVADFVRIADQRPHKAFPQRLQADDVLAAGKTARVVSLSGKQEANMNWIKCTDMNKQPVYVNIENAMTIFGSKMTIFWI